MSKPNGVTVRSLPDLSLILSSSTWRDNPMHVQASVATGHTILCTSCRRVIGIGKDDTSAEADAGTRGKRRGERWFCAEH